MQGNKEQNEAIVFHRGPAMILAGPGSGKTFVVVERVRHLIEVCKEDPAGILVITFTRAAARQMRDRFLARMGGTFHPVVFGTFHAVFFQILQTSCHYDPNSILTQQEKKEFLRMELLKTKRGGFLDPALEEGLLSEIGRVKNTGEAPGGFCSNYLEPGEFARIFTGFCRLVRQAGRLDLDDFAPAVKELFGRRPDVLAGWQARFPYILVDEFQDINEEQYEAVKILAGENKNLFVVGDDDQSIYGFRGADPAILQRFGKDFPHAACIRLGINYRSSRGIVETAGILIAGNKNRLDKRIRAQKAGQTEKTGQDAFFAPLSPDGCVRVGTFDDEGQEADRVAGKIGAYLESGKKRTVAAIFRTAAGAVFLTQALEKRGIPFTMRQKAPNLYAHPVCQDLLACLRFAKRARTRGDFLRFMNRPCRYISREMLPQGQVFFPALCKAAEGNPVLYENLRKLQQDIGRIAGMDLYAAVCYIRRGMGYDRWIAQQDKDKENCQKAADFFLRSVRGLKTLEQLEEKMREYGRSLERAQKGERREGTVDILTMHGAKGLEYDVVFLPGCNEGQVPHKKSASGASLEEERRMFYVGMTRAKERLFLSWHKRSGEEPALPSRFLTECGYRPPYETG